MTTVKGNFVAEKKDATIARNKKIKKARIEAMRIASDELLAKARAAFENSQEYEGVVVEPMLSYESCDAASLPWCLKEQAREVPPMDVLNEEIDRFYAYAKPNEFEQTARQHVIQQVRALVRKALKKCDVEVFGSERNGIPFATSDIDLRLLWPSQVSRPSMARLPPTKRERGKGMAQLGWLYNGSLKHNRDYLLTSLRHARYPLVAAQDRQSGLDVQIVLSNDTSVSRDYMQRYMQEIPYLRSLYYVVKTIFDIRGLSDVFRGGFGSYSIFMMLVASLKHAPHQRQDAAGGLLNFLKFYSDFDAKAHGISIEPVELFDKVQHPVITNPVKISFKNGTAKPLPSYMLCLRDPADETNDLGRKGIAIKHVQTTFNALYTQLVMDLKTNTRASLLASLVGPVYMLNIERRKKLQDYGWRLQNSKHASLAATAKAIREEEKRSKRGKKKR
ncbi:uncharacterized protein SETTUDRAFT_163578 [Exserohilum turcica Et28A]|uniref:polynucleotide adenylyltransferase n=1 Tax=Exserohilum turcicum (strain 28A) TaxID=671987 RepID=R0IIH8_EXST2|nr:uncharacterized protein SETTUDRAFT_163578 [Exserohilum turcica Et28A]EOA84736.1 hypothetical protein SETTUDRAFT_163578 [Exserohilum turcica Et28A]